MAKDLKIVYLISAYKLPTQLVRMVESIWHENDMYLIHVDKKSPPAVMDTITKGLSSKKNVIFLPRHRCYWGDFGHNDATMEGINYVIENKIAFTNFVVMTGQDMPTHSLAKTRQNIKNTKSSMEYSSLPTKNWHNGGMDRVQNYHFWIRDRHYSLPGSIFKRRAQKLLAQVSGDKTEDIKFYGGSSYFQIERPLVEYIHKLLKDQPYIERFFRNTFISDEVFFQTILLNSKYKNSITNDSKRYVDWTDPVEIPKIFRKKDLSVIKKSNAIFARKFDSTIDKDIIDLVLANEKN